MEDKQVLDLIIKSFTKTPDSYMRSTWAIARETGLSEEEVKGCLKKHPELFKYAPVVAPSSGSTIYHYNYGSR